MTGRLRRAAVPLVLAAVAGCGGGDPAPSEPTTSGKSGMGGMSIPGPDSIAFKDELDPEKVNASLAGIPEGLDGLVFVDTDNQRVALEDYIGRKNVVLVFTEGFAGMLCPFCKAQTSRLVANYDKFEDLDTEILVVYPGARDHLDEFLEAARTTAAGQVERVPFPIVLDEDLTATQFFEIQSNLAHPSTYVIDKLGKVRFAYVGDDMSADRPSVKALLTKLEEHAQ